MEVTFRESSKPKGRERMTGRRLQLAGVGTLWGGEGYLRRYKMIGRRSTLQPSANDSQGGWKEDAVDPGRSGSNSYSNPHFVVGANSNSSAYPAVPVVYRHQSHFFQASEGGSEADNALQPSSTMSGQESVGAKAPARPEKSHLRDTLLFCLRLFACPLPFRLFLVYCHIMPPVSPRPLAAIDSFKGAWAL